MFQAEEIERLIKQGLDCEFAHVLGDDGEHFTAIVVCAGFAGLSRVRQHQAVQATLGSLLGNEIHALQLQTFTPPAWAEFREKMGI